MKSTWPLALLAAFACPIHSAEIPLEDFEQAPLGQHWTASGAVQAERANAPEPAAGASGQALHLISQDRAVVISKPGALALKELPRAEYLVLRARGGKEATSFDLILAEEDRKAVFWRKVDLPAGGEWREVKLPLAWFRWESSRVPDWSRVATLGFRLRGASDLWVDGLALVDGEPDRGADVTLAELETLAFQGLPGQARHKDAGAYWLLTNAPSLDLTKLSAHLDQVLAELRRDLGLPEKCARPAVLIIFAEGVQYRDFVVRFARQLNAQAAPPRSDGYHLQGLALSSWSNAQGTLRPVFTHEFVHSVLSEGAGIDSSRMCWVQEGVANRYQLKFHPQASLAEIVAEGLEKPTHRMDFRMLCSGGNIPMNRYWQAATLVDALLADPGLRVKVPALLAAMCREGSTKLEPHLENVMGITWQELEAVWRRHAETLVK